MITPEDLMLKRETVPLNLDWLPPETGWEQLDAARERHIAIVSKLRTLRSKLYDVNTVYAAEDAKRDEQRAQDFTSSNPARLKHVTSETERTKVSDDLSEQAKAGYNALAEHTNATLELVREGKGELLRQRRSIAYELEQKRDAYLARARELDAELESGRKLIAWLARTAGEQRGFESDHMRLFPWGEVERPAALADPATTELRDEELARRQDESRSPFLTTARAAIVARDIPTEAGTPQTEQRSHR